MVHVVGVGNAKVGIEAVGGRKHFPLMAKMPLAEAGGGIILCLEVIGDGMLFRVQAFPGGREEHVLVHSHPLGIAPCQESSPGGGAYRRGNHEAGELPALLGDSIDVRGLDSGRAEAAQVSVALIVGEDDDEIRLGGDGGI